MATLYEIKKANPTAYKEAMREVEDLVRRMILSHEQQLTALRAALSEQGDAIVALEAEVAALKVQPTAAAAVQDETRRIQEGVDKANKGNV